MARGLAFCEIDGIYVRIHGLSEVKYKPNLAIKGVPLVSLHVLILERKI